MGRGRDGRRPGRARGRRGRGPRPGPTGRTVWWRSMGWSAESMITSELAGIGEMSLLPLGVTRSERRKRNRGEICGAGRAYCRAVTELAERTDRAGLGARCRADRGADGRRDLDRLGDPGLPWPAGRVDEEPDRREDVDAAELPRRSRGAPDGLADASRLAGVGRRSRTTAIGRSSRSSARTS